MRVKFKFNFLRFVAIIALFAAFCLNLAACGNEKNGAENASTTSASAPSYKVYSNEVQVVLLLGQSNMEGHTHSQYLIKTMGEEKAKKYAQGFGNVLMAYANSVDGNTSGGQFVPVKTGQGYAVDRFGPEVGMAEAVSEIDPIKPVYFIKYAYGGTTLINHWRSPSSGKTGTLYTGAVNYALEELKKLEDKDLYPVVKAICWMQGESDASGNTGYEYESLERNFVADLRNALAYYKDAEKEIAFVDAGISDCPAWTQFKTINDIKKKLADEDANHYYIDTIAEGLKYNAEPPSQPDIYHYDSASQIKLGKLFANVLLSSVLEV